jgi:ComF family protein
VLPAASFLLRLLWPQRCVACGELTEEVEAFCSACAVAALPLESACPRCARVLARPGAGCVACLLWPFPFRALGAPFVYGGSVAEAILSLKHGRRIASAVPLGRLLAPELERAVGEGSEVALPVPLHPRRLRVRGFNQALELLRAAEAQRRRRPSTPHRLRILVDTLRRDRDTPALGHEPPEARRQRLAGAFRVHHPERIAGRRVLLVDDVMTTGATARACTLALLGAGAEAVSVVALARTL